MTQLKFCITDAIEKSDYNFNDVQKAYIYGALKVLTKISDMDVHYKMRKIFFEEAKQCGDNWMQVFLTINKVDIDFMGC